MSEGPTDLERIPGVPSSSAYGPMSAEELATFIKMQDVLMLREEKQHNRRMDLYCLGIATVIVVSCLGAAFALAYRDNNVGCGAFLGAPVVVWLIRTFVIRPKSSAIRRRAR